VDALVDASIATDAAVLEGIPEGVTTALHICRGNYRSSWMCEGSLEPVAERVFGWLPYDAFLVEWDDLGRDGGYEPVRFLREGSVMVMGIVSSKSPQLEDEDDLVRRMEEAAGYAGGMDRLAISSQCGFASVMVGNEIDGDHQWRKLELVANVAERLWGRGRCRTARCTPTSSRSTRRSCAGCSADSSPTGPTSRSSGSAPPGPTTRSTVSARTG
jgi:5-methyltetrahydropteroyltriglutamate--homocysteine methyltransferase